MATQETPPDSLRTSLSLLRRLRDPGNRHSWEHFHTRYQPLVLTVARKAGLCHSDAQDVVQETLIEVARQMPGFQYDPARGSFKGWLLTIVRRRVANHWRAQSYKVGETRVPRSQALELEVVERQFGGEVEFEKIWDAEWKEHALGQATALIMERVRPLQFQIFKLHVLKGISAQEVARRLGVKLMQVYWARMRVGTLFKEACQQVERHG